MKSQSKLNLNWTRNISVKPNVFFPSNESLKAANDHVRSWSNKFPLYKILETFGPINMSKTWLYSEENIDFIEKNLKR